MKKIIIGISLLTSISSFATDFTDEERAQLHVLKMVLIAQVEQLNEVLVTSKENATVYSELSTFSLTAKRQLKAKNCGDVQSAVGANILMLATSLEQSKQALSKVELSDVDGVAFQGNFLEFTKNAKNASRKCKDIKASADLLSSSIQNLEIASEIMIKALPDLL